MYGCPDGYTTNIYCEINDSDEALKTIQEIAEQTEWTAIVYDMIHREGFKPINLNLVQDPEANKPIHLQKKEFRTNDTTNRKLCALKLEVRKLYYKMFRQTTCIHTNVIEDEMDMELLKAKLRWKWIHLLFPLSKFDNSINTVHIYRYIWSDLQNIIKLKPTPKLMLSIFKIHPLQICGTTGTILNRHSLHGNEIYLRNFKYYYANSAVMWTQCKGILDEHFTRYEDYLIEIYKIITYEHWYCGNEPLAEILRIALLCYDEWQLAIKNYPANAIMMATWIDETYDKNSFRKKMLEERENAERRAIAKKLYILRFLEMIK